MISGRTRIAAVLGSPIEHSRSPQILNAAFHEAAIDAVMIPVAASPSGFSAAIAGLRAIGAIGASVTSPHKLAAKAVSDQCSESAQAIGAVNCLHFDHDRVIGHNTDEQGFSDSLDAAGFTIPGKPIVVLGAGGAARAVVYAVRGAGSIEVFARDPDGVDWTAARPWTAEGLREAFARAALVVDCTPIGLSPEGEVAWVDALPLDALSPAAWVASLVYHRSTELLKRAGRRGHSTLDGRAMLVHQAARAFTIWTGAPAPIAVMTRALEHSLRGT